MNEPNQENHASEQKLLDAMIETMRAEAPGAAQAEGAQQRLRARLAQAQSISIEKPRRGRIVSLFLGSPRRAVGSAFGLAAAAMMMIVLSGIFGPAGAQAQAMQGAGDLLILGRDGQPASSCPLQHTDVQATLTGLVGRVTVTQTFHNPSPDKIEAVYVFPLPENAAVDAMTIVVDGRRIVGKMMPKQEAQQVYQAARAAGKVAGLLDQERPNIFTQSVANIEPGATIEVEISYVQTLKYEDGALEFVYPMTVAPRFNPAGMTDQAAGQAAPAVAAGTTPSAASAPSVPASEGPVFRIVILEGQTLESAQRLVKTLGEYRYSPIEVDQQNAAYRVLYGAFPTQEQAAQAQSKLAAAGILSKSIIRLDRMNPPQTAQPFGAVQTHIAPPQARAGHDISLSVNLDAGLTIQKIESKLHEVEIERPAASQAVVTLKNRREIPNRDFILRVATATDQIGDAMLSQTDERGTFFTLIMQPPQWTPPSAIVPKELLFVIDRSGSMKGWKIEKAKAAMHKCIEALSPDDTFNVLSFSNGVTRLFPASVPATPENIAQGLAFVESVQANGGTQFLAALTEALVKPSLDAVQASSQANGGAPLAGQTVRGIFRKYFMLPSLNGVMDEGPYLYSVDFKSWIRLYDAKGSTNGIADGTEISVRLGAPLAGMSPDRPTIDAVNPDGPDRVRFLGFMSDGEVGNDFQILDAVKRNAGTTRVFSFGVGGSVNRFLLQGMADLGRGAAEFVDENADPAAAAQRFFVHVNAPILTDVSIDWAGLPVGDLYPSPLPDLYSAKPVMVQGRIWPQKGFDPAMLAGKTITLRGRTAAGAFERPVKIAATLAPKHGTALAALWARGKIDALMHEDMAALQRGNFPEPIKQQIVALGVDFGLMTQFTSFVAVDEVRTTAPGDAKKVKVAGENPKDEPGAGEAKLAFDLKSVKGLSESAAWKNLTDEQKRLVLNEAALRTELSDNSLATNLDKQSVASGPAQAKPEQSWYLRAWDTVTGSDRSKVSRARADMRSLATGIESYVIDYNGDPNMVGVNGGVPGQNYRNDLSINSPAQTAGGSQFSAGNTAGNFGDGAANQNGHGYGFPLLGDNSSRTGNGMARDGGDSSSRSGNGMARQGGETASAASSTGNGLARQGAGQRAGNRAGSGMRSQGVNAGNGAGNRLTRQSGAANDSFGIAPIPGLQPESAARPRGATPEPVGGVVIGTVSTPAQPADPNPVTNPNYFIYPDALNLDALGKGINDKPLAWNYQGNQPAVARGAVSILSSAYDPSNGTQTGGDLYRFNGEAEAPKLGGVKSPAIVDAPSPARPAGQRDFDLDGDQAQLLQQIAASGTTSSQKQLSDLAKLPAGTDAKAPALANRARLGLIAPHFNVKDAASSGLTTSTLVAAVFVTPRIIPNVWFTQNPGPNLVVAAWSDGTVIWSGDPILGGAPYLMGKVAPEKIASLVGQIEKEGTFGRPELERAYFGPDASYTTLVVRGSRQWVNMRSWHELAGPDGVALSSGIVSLNGRDRAALLAAEPQEYQAFLRTWDALKTRLLGLIPQERKPVDVTFTYEWINIF